MFGPNLSGDEPNWIVAALFALAILSVPVGFAYIAYSAATYEAPHDPHHHHPPPP